MASPDPDTPRPRAAIVSFLREQHHASRADLTALGLSPEQVRRALRALAPALERRTDAQGRAWYTISDMAAAMRICEDTRPGPKPLMAQSAADNMEPGRWYSTPALAEQLGERERHLWRAMNARPDLFARRPGPRRIYWRLR